MAIFLLSVKFSIELEICAFVDTEVSNGKTGGKAAVQSAVKKPTDKVVDVKEAMRIDSILAGVLRKVSLMALNTPNHYVDHSSSRSLPKRGSFLKNSNFKQYRC